MENSALAVGKIVGTLFIKNLIIDDYRDDNIPPDFTSITVDDPVIFPCQNIGMSSLQLGLRFKNFVMSSDKKSFLKSVMSSKNTGGLYG